MNNEPMPAGLEALYADLQRALAQLKPVNPLAEATPVPWDTTPFPADVEL